MEHLFSPSIADKSLEGKIVVALERISEAFRVLLWKEGKEHALSPIQIQILIFLRFHVPGQCTVSYLAREFNMTKATISDSVRLLLQKGLLQKANHVDARSYQLELTKLGMGRADRAASFANPLAAPLASLTAAQKETLFAGLVQLIRGLNQQGILSMQRMCFTCANHEQKNGTHYCRLLQEALMPYELRLDCPEHTWAQ